VLSLANDATLISEVSLPITDFITRWVQSSSTFDTIVAATVPQRWARAHLPVLSTSEGHTLYTGFSSSEPNGHRIVCPGDCKREIQVDVRKNNVRHQCLKCGWKCFTPKVEHDKSTVLAWNNLLKVPFPQLRYVAPRKTPEKVDDQSAQRSEDITTTKQLEATAPKNPPGPSPTTDNGKAPMTKRPDLSAYRASLADRFTMTTDTSATGPIQRTVSLPSHQGSTPGSSKSSSSSSSSMTIRIPSKVQSSSTSQVDDCSGTEEAIVDPIPHEGTLVVKVKRSTGNGACTSGRKRQKRNP
jgi:hypothetical protein